MLVGHFFAEQPQILHCFPKIDPLGLGQTHLSGRKRKSIETDVTYNFIECLRIGKTLLLQCFPLLQLN